MRRGSLAVLFAIGAMGALCTGVARADNVSLYDGTGKAVAYIDMDDDMTIYLWGGKPVAYLDADGTGGEFNVYGFNGKHLGWFAHGVIWDHAGAAACADPDRMTMTQIEPIQGIQQIQPIKSIEEIAPVEPAFTNAFGDTPCEFLLASGSSD